MTIPGIPEYGEVQEMPGVAEMRQQHQEEIEEIQEQLDESKADFEEVADVLDGQAVTLNDGIYGKWHYNDEKEKVWDLKPITDLETLQKYISEENRNYSTKNADSDILGYLDRLLGQIEPQERVVDRVVEKEVRVEVIPSYVKQGVEKIGKLLKEASDMANQLSDNI